MILATTLVTYIRKAFIFERNPAFFAIFNWENTTPTQRYRYIDSNMNPNETASFNLSIVRVSIHFTYYFAQLLSNTFVQKTYQNIVNLYPYRDFIKSKVTNRRNNFQPLKNNEMPIKTPRFTSQNFFHLLIIIKNKQNRMITRVMDLEAISGTPERTKSPTASMFKAHLVRNFTAIVYLLELLSFFTNISPPSLYSHASTFIHFIH